MSSSVDQIESVLNDLSVLILTSDTSKSQREIKDHLKKVESLCSEDQNLSQIKDHLKDLLSASQYVSSELNEFIKAVYQYVRSPEGEFNWHSSSNALQNIQKGHPDFSDELDQELLVEFIEKHSSALEEFEAILLDPDNEGGNYAEVSRQARGYIHNIKGDAGSLGINGIEKICHFIEDKIDEEGVKDMIEPLIQFKEWVSSWLKALSEGHFRAQLADEFKVKFIAALDECKGNITHSESQNNLINSIDDEDNSNANLDLLAELLAEVQVEEVKDLSDEYPIEGDAEVFVEFVNEAEDHLGAVESTILDAAGTYTKDMIDTIFRGVHSIKGASSYFKLLEITETSHQTESLMDEVRTGKRNFDQGLADLILIYVDLQRRLISKAKEAAGLGEKIHRIKDSSGYLDQLKEYSNVGKSIKNKDDKVKKVVTATEDSEIVKDSSESKSGEKLDIKNYVKVETDRLDHLIDAIGEMAIYSSMLIDNVRQELAGNEHLIKVTHQVEKFGRELQQIGMAMRLIPIRGLFQKMSRLVWDVARKIGKEVKFSMEGEDTELDRTIIEKLADPLMHMIRNAIDHGIEPPDEREEKGKDRAGKIELKALHAGGNIHIQIIDDGRGLNPEKLIAKAREKGILGEHEKLTDSEAYQLIFAAGFSTAAAVTDISGRGVGMDVVRRNIESMRGRVHIDSTLGKGTIFTIELPLTLAIIDGISVRVGMETFIIPTLSVVEFMQPKPDQITRALDKGDTFFFRGRYLPLYRLGTLFDVESDKPSMFDSLVVVVENAGTQFAVLVDDIVSTHSTVIKSVGEMYSTNRGLAGCAIMPSGDIALILDLRSLLELAKATYTYSKSSKVEIESEEIMQ